MRKHLQKLALSCYVVAGCWSISTAQNVININESSKITKATSLKSGSVPKSFEDAERYRTFSYNTRLKSLKIQNIGDTLLLDFFEDKKYKAVIKNISQSYDGITGIVSQIADADFAYCYISVSDKGISISADIPSLDEQYFVGTKSGKSYLSQYKISAKQKDALGCGTDDLDPVKVINSTPLLRINEKNEVEEGKYSDEYHNYSPQPKAITEELSCADQAINNPYTVNVLVVYTTAAKNWAASDDSNDSDIDAVINQAFLRSNTVAANSQIGVTYNVVHKYEAVGYTELDNADDLHNIRKDDDGYMDEIHALRNTYKADLVVFLAEVSFTGGLGYLFNGQSQYGFCLNRVQQTSWTYTVVHEMGHNMGCSHDKDQTSSPGGNGRFAYSNGWHGVDASNNKICTVMTYENFLPEGQHTRIPYFSSPDIIYNGVAIGDAGYANNALTIRRTKRDVAFFSEPQLSVGAYNYTITYGNPDPTFNWLVWSGTLLAGDEYKLTRDPGSDAGSYAIKIKIYRGETDVTCEYSAYLQPGALTINKRDISANLANGTVTYNGAKQYISQATLNNAIAGNSIAFTYEYSKNDVVTDYALNAGVYTVTASTDGDKNHNGASKTATFTVNKAQATITLEEKTVAYTGNPIEIDAPVTNPTDASVITTYTGIDGTVYTTSQTAPTEVGKYKVEVTFSGNDNYLGATQYTTLTITTALSIGKETSYSDKVTVTPTKVKSGKTFTIRSNIDRSLSIEVYNLSGVLINKVEANGSVTKISAPTVPGTYIIVLRAKESSTEKKLIVE
ncbi:MAG: M12 family metallo-peptidase [Dysgonomonas sp.]